MTAPTPSTPPTDWHCGSPQDRLWKPRPLLNVMEEEGWILGSDWTNRFGNSESREGEIQRPANFAFVANGSTPPATEDTVGVPNPKPKPVLSARWRTQAGRILGSPRIQGIERRTKIRKADTAIFKDSPFQTTRLHRRHDTLWESQSDSSILSCQCDRGDWSVGSTRPQEKMREKINSEKAKFEIRILNSQGLTPPTTFDPVGAPRVHWISN